MADKTIEIIVDVADKTGGKLKSIQNDLLAMDKSAQRLANKFKSLSTLKYAATIRLIDRVSDPAGRINSLLKRIANRAWRISFSVTDGALGKIRQVEASLMRIAGKAWTIGLNVRDGVSKKINGLMSGAMMGAGMFMPVAGMAGVGFGVANAIQAYAGFEQQMSKVQAIRQLSKDSAEMKALVQQAKDLGAATAWTRQQVGEAQYYQALAGWETPQILKATPHMLNLASAGGIDLGSASDMVTDAMTAFGLKATDTFKNAQGRTIDMAEYFVDMAAKLQASSNTDLLQMREAFKYGAPTIGMMFGNVAGQEGIQLRTEAARQMMIMTGLMANAGIKGSMAGTGINTLFNRLAGENRNTFFAEHILGLEHAENGNMLMPLEFIKGFQRKIRDGMSVDDFYQVAEELAGEKIHADTRRKLNSTIESAMKNGGKLGSADVMKMASMLAGLENMPKLLAMTFQDIESLEAKMNSVEGTAGEMASTMLDNLAGSFTILGSAWDAFQQSFLEGQAGEGLRGFVDTLTDMITRANKLFSDGIQIGDLGKIIGDVIGRLKNKFLELDGIGSVLAGGALMAGLTKIVMMSQRAVGTLRNVRSGLSSTSTGGTGLSATQKVGTMNVSAGVVNVNGKVAGGGAGRKVGNTAIIDNYNATKERIRGTGTPPPPVVSRIAGMRTAAMGGAAFAGIFGLLDVMNVKAMNAERLASASESERAQIIRENRQAEWEAGAGATGAVLGSAMGAALGSIAGPMGTAIGGVIGGMIGQMLGVKVGEEGASREKTQSEEGASSEKPPSATDYFGFNNAGEAPRPPSWSDFRHMQEAEQKATQSSFASFRKADEEATRLMAERNKATATQLDRFQKINNKLGVFSPFKDDGGAFDYYAQQRERMMTNPSDFYGTKDLWGGGRAHAAELNAEQMAQMEAMERGEVINAPSLELGEVHTESFAESLYSQLESVAEGVGEFVSNLGTPITENLSAAMDSAGEIFSGLGEMIGSGLESAQSAAVGALESIQSAFTTAKETIQSAWSELPGFFGGVFESLGGVAAAAGAAIYSGLTSVIGSIIGAWEGAASTISGIISSISSMAASAVNLIPSFGGLGGKGFAEGGFVDRETHFFAGEHGAEAIIPLDSDQRGRALELFNQTADVLGVSEELPDFSISSGESSGSGGITINLGGVTFQITGDNPQGIMQEIQENIQELADKIAAQLAVSISDIHHNQCLEA